MNEEKPALPEYLRNAYQLLREPIRRRLAEFRLISESKYFYEMCFCIMTPQSRAKSAAEVQQKLEDMDFYGIGFEPVELLRDARHYIRFHNQKSVRLLKLREDFPELLNWLRSDIPDEDKREQIHKRVNGFGMKESAHFMRNIGYRDMAILDRHILKHLVKCGVFDELPSVATVKRYREVEAKFREFSARVNVPLDELDLLFWSYETGEILK